MLITHRTVPCAMISTITDGAGRVYSFTYSNNLLTRLSFKSTGSTELTYVTYSYTNSTPTTVTYKDGGLVTYTYNTGHILLSASDVDGYKIVYSYNVDSSTFAPCRVFTVKEYDGTTEGKSLTISYEHNQTTFKDSLGNVEIMQFNNWGNAISIQDDEGRAQYIKYARNDINDTVSKANQLTLSSKMQTTVNNLIFNNDFEYGNYNFWFAESSDMSLDCEILYGNAYNGNNCLLLGGAPGAAVKSRYFTIQPDETYTVSGYVKANSGAFRLGIRNSANFKDYKFSEIATEGDGWKRIQVSYTNTSSSSKMMYALFSVCEMGVGYLDCVQVEASASASNYNFVQNGDFDESSFLLWVETNNESGDGITEIQQSATDSLDNSVYKMTGHPFMTKMISQTLTIGGNAGDSFVFSGWAKGNSASLLNIDETFTKDFALRLYFRYSNGNSERVVVQFNPDVENWQFASGVAVAEQNYTSVTIEAVYSQNANTVYFDGLQLFREEFGTSYTYDDKGNVISVIDLQDKTTDYEYDTNNNLTRILQDNKAKMTYTYYEGTHNVKTATTEEGLTYSFEYDTYGNNTKVSITNGTKTISSTATYTSNGNLLSTTTDALGKVTTYSYNANTGLLDWVKYPEDTDATRTNYTYDSMYRTASAAVTTDTGLSLSAGYTYTDDLLTSITTPSTTYSFTYGDFSLRSAVNIGSRKLAEYNYDAYHRLETLDYGNGDKVQYTYDSKSRVIRETYEDGAYVSYIYDGADNLAAVIDSETGITTTYNYDLINRLVGYREKSDTLDHSVIYIYDANNNVSSMTETINDVTKTYTYTYDEDNRLVTLSVDGTTMTYTYDDLGRIYEQEKSFNGTRAITETLSYHSESTITSELLAGKTIYMQIGFHLDNNFDDNGNITEATNSIVIDGTTTYTYDSANQITREINHEADMEWTWTYDEAGNILSRSEYDRSDDSYAAYLGTATYTYGDSEWGDLLTSYNGNNITYDEVGNPLSDGTWSYTWKHGRQLAVMTRGRITWNYIYNADGMRISRSNGTDTYTYVYNGSQLTSMTKGTDTLYFTYDAAGAPLSVNYNGTTYYYLTNNQGDVLYIVDTAGNLMVSYVYNAWGELLSIAASMATTLGVLNPLRYRGYVYDQETGLYYLQSRYYNPEWGRFINADYQLSTGSDFASHNLFAYCGNNPVNRIDPTGEAWWHWAIGAAVVVGLGILTVATCGGSLALAATSVGLVANGIAAASTATTVAAAAFIGSATVYGVAALSAASNSNSIQEFNAQGNWGTVAATAGGALFGGYNGYTMSKAQTPHVPSNAGTSSNTSNMKYPGNDPTKCDVPGFEWRGSGSPVTGHGNYVNMQTGEWLHPDLNHGPPIGPHWDYGVRGSSQTFRIFPDGSMSPK